MRYMRFFAIASLLIFLFCPPVSSFEVSGDGDFINTTVVFFGGEDNIISEVFIADDGGLFLAENESGEKPGGHTAPAVTSTSGASIVVKNACGAYTRILGVDLLSVAKDTLLKAGFKIRGEMELPIWRFETYIHYYPGDESSADRVKTNLGVGKKMEDKTLTFGLIKVILGADVIPHLFPYARKTRGDPKIYFLDATDDKVTLTKIRDLFSDFSDDILYRDFVVNKGMSEGTVIYYPTGSLKSAEKIEALLGMGDKRVISGIWDIFVVLGPDFSGEEWHTVPDWEPDPNVGYEVVIYKTRYIMEIRDPSGKVLAEFPISIGANPDIDDKKEVGDWRTPEGDFPISMIQPSTDWRFDDEQAYGPWFIRLEANPWSGIGIHGTNEPYLIGAPVSHGCIRLHSENIEKLKGVVRVGTKVKIVH
jgi:hypothetical protein